MQFNLEHIITSGWLKSRSQYVTTLADVLCKLQPAPLHCHLCEDALLGS
jgi:hypothetical protein